MKCFIAILLLALVAVAMAVEKTSESNGPKAADARDKRGLAYSPYAYGSYGHNPYAYSPYAYGSYNLPYTYSSPYSYPYRYHYPYYNNLHNYVY